MCDSDCWSVSVLVVAVMTALFGLTETTSLLPSVTSSANRLGSIQVAEPPAAPAPPEPVGIFLLPFAPPGLDACDEMMFYANQFGLDERFRRIGWRESRCRNQPEIRTACCHGYFQLYVSLHLRSSAASGWAACGITSIQDVNQNTPESKQKQACGVSVLYTLSGTGPWAATR